MEKLQRDEDRERDKEEKRNGRNKGSGRIGFTHYGETELTLLFDSRRTFISFYIKLRKKVRYSFPFLLSQVFNVPPHPLTLSYSTQHVTSIFSYIELRKMAYY